MQTGNLKTIETEEDYKITSSGFADFDQAEMLRKLTLKFDKQKLLGRIKSGFDDDTWIIQEVNAKTGRLEGNEAAIHFRVDQALFEKYGADITLYEDFQRYLKEYALILYDDNDFTTIIRKIPRLIKLIEDRLYFQRKVRFTSVSDLSLFLGFCTYLPLDIKEYLFEIQITPVKGKKKLNRPRCLCNLVTYYTLNEELEEFWVRDASEKEKNFYFPFYLFWKIVSIVPMRPIEFAKTPLDCLKRKKDGFYFVRVFGEKKGHGPARGNSHDSSNYPTEEVPIPEEIAIEIKKFQDFRKAYPDNGYLFSTAVISDNNPVQKNKKYKEFFDSSHLLQIKNIFYEQYLFKQKGYEKITDHNAENYRLAYDGVKENRIEIIDCEDVRHISMINLMRNGCSLTALMKISHHKTAAMSTWYSNNVDQFEKAKVFVLVSKNKKRFVKEHIASKQEETTIQNYKTTGVITYENAAQKMEIDPSKAVDMGDVLCISEKRMIRKQYIEKFGGNQDITDCLEGYRLNPGNPCLKCRHKLPKKQTVNEIDKQLKRELKVSLKMTLRLIPTKDGETLVDVDSRLQEYLDQMENYTEIQNRTEVEKYQCHRLSM